MVNSTLKFILQFSSCFCHLVFSHGLVLSPLPISSKSIKSGFDCTTVKNLPLSIQSGMDVFCPFCPLEGTIAMHHLCQQGQRIPKAMSDLELHDNKTSRVYLFFIQINKIYIFWLTTDNFHFRNPFSGALIFFLIIGDSSKELLKQ